MIKGNERRVAVVCVCVALFLAAVGAAGCGGGHATAEPTAGTWTPVATAAPTSAPATATEAVPASASAEPSSTAAPAATATASSGGGPTPGPDGWRPPTGPVTPGATPWELPYRVVVTGPDTAHSGDEVTYEIQYQCVLDAHVCAQTAVTFRMDWPPALSLIGFSPAAGLDPRHGPTDGGLNLYGPGGTDQITFRIAAGFTGDVGVGISLTGSGLYYRWPDGSGEVTTHVTE